MSGEEPRFAGMEETLFALLRAGGSVNMEQGNLLILLSLVNLMGIINIISHRAGIKSLPLEIKSIPEENNPGMRGPVDPSALLSILGGKGGTGPGHLAGLLSRFMGPQAGQFQGQSTEEAREEGVKSGA